MDNTENDFGIPHKEPVSTEITIQDASSGLVKNFDYEGAYNSLTPQQLEAYRQKGSSIDVFNARSIMEFGQDASKEYSRLTDTILSKTRSNDDSEITQLTNKLTAEFKNKLLPGESAPKTSWLAYIPWFGKRLAKAAQDELIKRSTYSDNIKEMSEKFVAMKSLSMTDNAFLEDVATKIQKSIDISHDDIMTLMVRLNDVQEELDRMERDPDVQIQALQATRMAVRRLKRQIGNLSSIDEVLSKTMLMAGVQMSSNDDIIEIADIYNIYLIPIYKLQCAMAITGRNAENSAELERLMKECANRAYISNAKALAETAKKLAEMTEGPIYEQQTLEKTQDILLTMAKDVKQIKDNGDKQFEDMMSGLKRLSLEMDNALRDV